MKVKEFVELIKYDNNTIFITRQQKPWEVETVVVTLDEAVKKYGELNIIRVTTVAQNVHVMPKMQTVQIVMGVTVDEL